MDVFRRMKSLDAYPKTLEDFSIKTYSGAIISLFSLLFMLILFVSELNYYMAVTKQDHLLVDVSREELMKINVELTFPHLPCNTVSLDTMDVSGEQQLDVVNNIWKRRLDPNGKPIGESMKDGDETVDSNMAAANDQGVVMKVKKSTPKCGSCFGAGEENECCNTCEEVREAYRRQGWAFTNPGGVEQCKNEGFNRMAKDQAGEGCNVYGFLEVSKVAGNFHLAPGRSFQHANMHIHDFLAFRSGIESFNMTHTVNHLSFGDQFPGQKNPLDNLHRSIQDGSGMHQYFIKVVPTTYKNLKGVSLHSNQFSATEHYRTVQAGQGTGVPGVFFFYDLSPIMVNVEEKQQSLIHFFTSACAIVGGVFTVSGMLDKILYHGHNFMKNKMRSSSSTGQLIQD